MRIEDVNEENVDQQSDSDLKNLRARANQMFGALVKWQQSLHEGVVGVNSPIKRDDMLESYGIICKELHSRGFKWDPDLLDNKLLSKALKGVDVAEMHPIMVKRSVVALCGQFVQSPKTADWVDVVVDGEEFNDEVFTQDLEIHLAKQIEGQTGRSVVVRRDSDVLDKSVIPVFDLVLLPRLRTVYDGQVVGDLRKRLDVRLTGDQEQEGSKIGVGVDKVLESESDDPDNPTVEFTDVPDNSEIVSIQRTGSFSSMTRKPNALDDGIHAVWGVLKGKDKVQSIVFDADKFTPAQAKKWLEEHDYKTDLEAVAKKSFIKGREEERIVGGIVYSASMYEDSQGDYANAADIYKAMRDWMIETGGVMKFMHSGNPIATPVIENFFAEEEVRKDGQIIEPGSWYLSVHVPEKLEDLWQAIKDGDITGFSMSGQCSVIEDE